MGSVERATIDAANYSAKLTDSLENMRGLIGAEADVEAMMRSHGYVYPEVPEKKEQEMDAEERILGKLMISAERICGLEPWARDFVAQEIKNKSWRLHKPTELWASPKEYERLSSAVG